MTDERIALEDISETLQRNITYLNILGTMFAVGTAIFSLWLYHDIKGLIGPHIMLIKDANESRNQVLAYLIYRSVALAGIATGLLYFGAKLSLNSFDQAMRFTKRRIGSKFLEHLFDHYDRKISSEVTLPQIMLSFEVWNKTVESAFSSASTPTGRQDDAAIKAFLKQAMPAAPKSRKPREPRKPAAPTS